MENLLLPRRERLFNYGGKLHFQNFSALFQGALSTSFPSGKYHCKAKSLSKTISRLRHIIAKGNKVSIPGDASHTALFPTCTHYPVGSPTLKSQNFDGFSGFLTGSCEGAYASQISLLTKQTLFFVCLSFARLLLLPKSTKVSFGGPFP